MKLMFNAIKQKLAFRYTFWWFLLANYKRKICNDMLSPDQKSALEDFEQGIALFNRTNPVLVKPKKQVYKDLNRLMKYWHCYPDVYFRMGMFLRGYTDWEQMKSFLPQIAFYRFERQWRQYPEYAFLLENKIIFNDFCTFYGIPAPKVLFCYRNGKFFSKEGTEILDEVVNGILSTATPKRLFAKKAVSSRGEGVSVYIKINDNYYTKEKTLVDAAFIRKVFGKDDCHIEEQLSQDRVLWQFCPDTINTIRVVTINSSGTDSIIVGAAVRFGRVGGFVDNLSQGGLSVNLNIETGELFDYGMRKYDLTRYYEHPDTRIKFSQVIVPQWPVVKKLIERVSYLLPPFREIGWDIALTLDGPVIVELNTGTGISSVQMGPKYGLAKAFMDYIPHFTD